VQADQERVLVLAPTRADAALSKTILTDALLGCHVCGDLSELLQEWSVGAGAMLLTDDVLSAQDPQHFVRLIEEQPVWSDLPIILLSGSGADSDTAVWAMERLGNVTVLERPVRVTTLVSALQTAIRARRRQYELRDRIQAQELLAAVVRTSQDAIISKTLDGIITSWNPGAQRLFGYTPEEAIGQPITLIIPPDRHDEERRILQQLRRGERLEHMETVRVAKNGQRLDISVTISVIRDAEGRIVGASKVARDITARKRATDLLRASEARFRFLAETIPSIVWTTAPDGKVTYVNRRWLEYCGIDDWEKATSPGLTLHPEDEERCTKAWQWHLRKGRDFEIEVRHRRHDGVYRWFVARAVPFRDETGKILSWFGTTTDIHEQKEMEETLRQADRRKDEFLATLAHELRNPLAPIRNSLHIMRLKGDDPVTVDQARKIMDRQLGQMVRLVDDLLDVGRITRGKLELRKERVELGAVIKNAIDATRPLIQAAGHELDLSLASRPVYLDADPVRLAQVLSNLLNNAAKYMDRGGKIWLSAVAGDHEVTITVRDKGIGIPPAALPLVFDMFTQVDASLERTHGGLGIGLTLAKQLVELHGGGIEARSEGIGRGSEFAVRLPIVSSASREERSRDQGASTASQARYRILVADDNHDAVESMGMMLRLMGNEVRTVRDGVQAVEEAAGFRPDMVLLDIGMPRLNGYDAARRIREQRWGSEMILVALTGWGQEEDKRRATEAGFDLHFTKPVSPADLEKLMAGLQSDPATARRFNNPDQRTNA
jgi:two-component system CheB/CheR fusion protein